MTRGPQARIRHAPVPDPTNTFCTVSDCRRLLGHDNKREHRRGSSARAPGPISAFPEQAFHSNPLAALEERVELQAGELRRLRDDVDRLIAAQGPAEQLRMETWRGNRPDREGKTRASV